MKKRSLFVWLTALLVAFLAFSCGKTTKNQADENTVVIHPSNDVLVLQSDTTFMEYLEAMKEKGLIDFTTSSGMIISVNGIENKSTGANSMKCWMVYTSDESQSNQAYGVLEYEGVSYASASFGADMLIVKEEFVYILAYHEVKW